MSHQPKVRRKLSWRAKVESGYPFAISLLSTCGVALYVYFSGFYPSYNAITNILSATIDFAAIAVGFLVAILSMLPSLEDRRVIKNIKSNQSYSKLVDNLQISATLFIILILTSLIGFLINFETLNKGHFAFLLGWFFIFSSSLSTYYRAIRIFSSILKSN
jgi:hypothetical protein